MLGTWGRLQISWAVFGFALMSAYWPGISGVATTPRWDVAVLLAPALFMCPRVNMHGTHLAGLALVGWLILSLSWSEGRLDGVDAAFQLLLITFAFAIGSLAEDLAPLFVGAALGLSVSSGLAIAQAFGWQGLEVYSLPAGLFYNGDRLAAAAALVGVGLVAMGRPWMAVLLLPSLLLPQSRAAWLAVAVGLMALPLRTERFTLLFILRAVGAVGAVATLLWRYGSADGGRLALWRDTVDGLTIWGHGLGSFWQSFPTVAYYFDFAAQGTRPEHPHNELLWVAYEGGVPAVILLAAFVALLIRECKDSDERGVLAAFVVLSMFAMPLHDPATAVLGSIVAGCCASRGRMACGKYVDRGGSIRAGLGGAEGRNLAA